jgi:uncharacterized membrane protein
VLVYALADPLTPALRRIVAGDAFFAAYLASSAWLAFGATPDALRRRASYADEGVVLIIVLTLCTVALCLAALLAVLGAEGGPDLLPLALAVGSVLLGWLTLHTVAAFRYAHLYYAPAARPGTAPDARARDAGGLTFPGDSDPSSWDFLYYALVIGMTAQVSDVQAVSAPMRRTTLAHGLTSFFFNTVILALAVNIAASLAR